MQSERDTAKLSLVAESTRDVLAKEAARRLAQRLASLGEDVVATFAPGAEFAGEQVDPMTAAGQLQTLIQATIAQLSPLHDLVMAHVDTAFASGVSLAAAARSLGVPHARLKADHLAWRRAHPGQATRETYRERDHAVFLEALKLWLKAHKGQVPTFGVSVPHPRLKGEELKLGYWVHNQRTTRRAGKGRQDTFDALDKLIPGWCPPPEENRPGSERHRAASIAGTKRAAG